MDNSTKLLSDLSSWYWWVSIVFVGLLINVASAYLKPYLDHYFEGQSDKRRVKSDAERQLFEQQVHALAANSTLLILEGQSEQRYRTQALILFVVASLSIVLGILSGRSASASQLVSTAFSLFFSGGGILGYVLAMYFMRHANGARRRVETATRRYLDGNG